MNVKLQLFRHLLVAMAVGFLPVLGFGQVIEIATEAQLRDIAKNLSGEYKLVSDITLTSDWQPIGDNKAKFSGTIDGNGKTIYGLRCEDSNRNGVGLIGVSEGAVIKNLKLINVHFYGKQDVGAAVGRAYAPTTLEKCYTSGIVQGKDHVGGIVGGTKSAGAEDDLSTIKDCFSTALVKSSSWQAGGIIGTTVAIEISNTYFAGVAYCPSGRTGGIAALADGKTTKIEKSISMAAYLGGDEANRVLGSPASHSVTLANNYSWEATKVEVKGKPYTEGESNPAGVDGEHKDLASLKSAAFYTTLGWSPDVWKVEDGKFPILAGQSYPLDADAIYFEPFPSRALPGGKHATRVASALGRKVSCHSSRSDVASINDDGLVEFHKDGSTEISFSTTGDEYAKGLTLKYNLKVEGISYKITSEADLFNIKYDLNGEFTLMNDITLTKDWTPLGTFKGKLNGNGKIIYGLRVDDKEKRNKGLFSETEGAEITKLGIERAYVVGNEDVAALVGNMKGGLIDQCYVADSYIAGRDHVGALVGAMRSYDAVVTPADPDKGISEVKEKRYATVRNSHSGAQVYSRQYQAGGLVGIVRGGIIENCYFSGEVQAEKGRAAAIVSLVDSDDPGEIKNNINLAAGGYCGEKTYRIGDWGSRGPESGKYAMKFINNWSKQQSYFGTNPKNAAVQEGQKDNDRNGANLSNDNDARTKTFFQNTLGWDFNTVWQFVAGTEGKLYPILAWQKAPLSSKVYGIPALPYLVWYSGSTDALDLKKIIPSTGQDLKFSVTGGGNLVELDGSWLYVTENTLSQGGIAKLALASDAALAATLKMDKTEFDVEVILRDAFNEIGNVEEFLKINNKLFAKFRLTNNIDLSGVDFPGFGSSSLPFTGQFDGNGYVVRNAVIKTGGENVKGLFNATDGALIKKLGVENIKFEGLSKDKGVDIGGLVGACRNTTIEECYVTGEITGKDHVGGFVGGKSDNVSIRNCYAQVDITAGQQVGGFFGVTAGTVRVENSYFAGNLNAVSRGWSGGIIGLIDKKGDIEISGCVAIGNIVSKEVAGYHIAGNMKDGDVERGTIKKFLNNRYNEEATLTTNAKQWVLAGPQAGVLEEALAVSADNLKKQATYTALGWDFDKIWSIEEGAAYPTLKQVGKKTALTAPQNEFSYSFYTEGRRLFVFGLEEGCRIQVLNLSGQSMLQVQADNRVELSLPGAGIYLLRIMHDGRSSVAKVLCR